jgi:hypothetical protein
VPTAYDDLVGLLNDSQGTLAKQYDHLPSFLQKLITQLPNKLTSNLAPELLAVATEAQALNVGASAASAGAGFAGAAKSFLRPNSLKDLVTKPGAVVSLLKAIMNALKLRWPAFMGTNVLLSLGLFGESIHFCHLEQANCDQFSSSYSGIAISAVGKLVWSARRQWTAMAVLLKWTTTQCSEKRAQVEAQLEVVEAVMIVSKAILRPMITRLLMVIIRTCGRMIGPPADEPRPRSTGGLLALRLYRGSRD